MPKILVLGATGVLGRRVARRLVSEGCTVVGTGTGTRQFPELSEAGVKMQQLDVLDKEQLADVVSSSGHDADAVVNLVGKLPTFVGRSLTTELDAHNTMRTLMARPLLNALKQARPTRYIAVSQTFCSKAGFSYKSKSSTQGLDTKSLQGRGIPESYSDAKELGVDSFDMTNRLAYASEMPDVDCKVRKLAEFNQAILRYENHAGKYETGFSTVLRLGFLYGKDTMFGKGGAVRDLAEKGQLQICGGGQGMWSFVHIDDAAEAIVKSCLYPQQTGKAYNVVGHAASTVEWMHRYSAMLGTKPIPARPFAKFFAPHQYHFATQMREAEGGKFNEDYEWWPSHPSLWDCDE
eukprot:Rhum_TRINITY_DN4176_c0_g1::Rhum_TRINITY_DN4176_c0_g1_i1::g.13153::m.13153